MESKESGDANIAAVASLLADPVRATIMITLSDGRALPAGELARLAHVAPSTASSHLSKLTESGLIEVEPWGFGIPTYSRQVSPYQVRQARRMARATIR